VALVRSIASAHVRPPVGGSCLSRPTERSPRLARAAHRALWITLATSACTTPDITVHPTQRSRSIGNPVNAGSANPLTLAVIGDTPYGPAAS